MSSSLSEKAIDAHDMICDIDFTVNDLEQLIHLLELKISKTKFNNIRMQIREEYHE